MLTFLQPECVVLEKMISFLKGCEIYFQTESSFDAAQTCFFFSLAFAHLLFTRCWVAFLLADICLRDTLRLCL